MANPLCRECSVLLWSLRALSVDPPKAARSLFRVFWQRLEKTMNKSKNLKNTEAKKVARDFWPRLSRCMGWSKARTRGVDFWISYSSNNTLSKIHNIHQNGYQNMNMIEHVSISWIQFYHVLSNCPSAARVSHCGAGKKHGHQRWFYKADPDKVAPTSHISSINPLFSTSYLHPKLWSHRKISNNLHQSHPHLRKKKKTYKHSVTISFITP